MIDPQKETNSVLDDLERLNFSTIAYNIEQEAKKLMEENEFLTFEEALMMAKEFHREKMELLRIADPEEVEMTKMEIEAFVNRKIAEELEKGKNEDEKNDFL